MFNKITALFIGTAAAFIPTLSAAQIIYKNDSWRVVKAPLNGAMSCQLLLTPDKEHSLLITTSKTADYVMFVSDSKNYDKGLTFMTLEMGGKTFEFPAVRSRTGVIASLESFSDKVFEVAKVVTGSNEAFISSASDDRSHIVVSKNPMASLKWIMCRARLRESG